MEKPVFLFVLTLHLEALTQHKLEDTHTPPDMCTHTHVTLTQSHAPLTLTYSHTYHIPLTRAHTHTSHTRMQVTHVVLFDFPNTIVDYLHRVGRTGRVGSQAGCKTTAFMTHKRDIRLAWKIKVGLL